MAMSLVWHRLLALPATVLLLSGCAGTTTIDGPAEHPAQHPDRHPDHTPAAVTHAPGSTLLASRTLSGGLCADGPCGSGLRVRVDGRYVPRRAAHRVTGTPADAALRTLVRALPATHLHVTKKVERFCPSSADGPDLTVSYLDPTDGRRVRVSSCDYTFGRDPLVSALARLEDRLASGRTGRG
jgi:hypothetical protein